MAGPIDIEGKLAALTPGQRDCLLLVRQHKTSKQIARELGIAKDTADQRIAAAMRKLGAASRTDAALMLDPAKPYDRIVYDRVGLAAVPDDRSTLLPHSEAMPVGTDRIREAQAPWAAIAPSSPDPQRRSLQRALDLLEHAHDLRWPAQLAIMVAIAFGGIAALLVTLAASSALSSLLR